MYIDPTIADFKSYFVRDFPYGSTLDVVIDQDITNALADAKFNINQGLFGSQSNYTLCFLLLSAHYLVTNLRNSSQGIAGQYAFLQASKGVGSVSESSNIPQRILDNPELSMLCKTNYGAKFVQFLLPQLTGQVFTVRGHTKA
jgi:hypothetical protein